jgi:hypothetical protein
MQGEDALAAVLEHIGTAAHGKLRAMTRGADGALPDFCLRSFDVEKP